MAKRRQGDRRLTTAEAAEEQRRQGDRRLTTAEAAEELGYSVNTLRSWRHRGEGPKCEQPKGKRGKAFYWLSDIEAWRRANQ